MIHEDNTDIKLTIGDLTIAVKGRTWEQTPGCGMSRIGNSLVRFTYPERVEGGSYPHYLEGTIHPEDLDQLPPNFLASLTRQCSCGNAISEDDDWCDYCLEHAPESPEDVYREPTAVIIAEQAQREYDSVWNDES